MIKRREQGTLLVLVVMILAVISLFALSMGYTLRQKLQVMSRIDARQKLQLVGESAVKKAISVLLPEDQRIYRFYAKAQSWSHDPGTFRNIEIGDAEFSIFYTLPGKQAGKSETRYYGVIDEERKLHLNKVRSMDGLKRLIQSAAKLPQDEAKAIAESIFDWRDEDDDTSLAGAEAFYYKKQTPSYRPRNADFVTLEELRLVKGVTEEIYQSITPYLTLESSGKVNINTAEQPVFLALGLPESVANKIIEFRRGRDQVEGTPDDLVFREIGTAAEELANALYLDENETSNLQSLADSDVLSVLSKTFSVHVEARLKNKSQALAVDAVFNQDRKIQKWHEEFFQSV